MKEEMLAIAQILFTLFNAAIALLVINCVIAPLCGLSIKVTYDQAIMYCMLSKLAHMAVKQHDMF